MVITIRGLKNGLANAASVTALLSAVTAVVKSKKTFAMQLTPFGSPSILDYLEGQRLKDEEVNAGFKVWSDEGIDELIIKSQNADLSKEHFDSVTTALLDKENLFDVLAPTTNSVDFFEFLKEEDVINIIEGAKKVYDYVYILLPERQEVIDIVYSKADENIVVIPQGPKVELENIPENVTYVINDFEKNSVFTVRDMAKEYGTKKMYVLPHNYLYRDAIIQKTLFDFVLKNKKDIKADINFDFTSSVSKLLGKYIAGIDDDDEDEAEELPKKKPAKDKLVQPQIDDIPDDAIQEIIVKKGLFRKKKKLTADL